MVEYKPLSGQRILRLPDVMNLVGLSRSSIYDLMARGKFPRAVSLGGYKAVGWRSNEVDDWVASRPVAGSRGAQA